MSGVSLGSRLMTAARLCRKGSVVCDVGTDHALLACYLAQNGAKEVIASDIKEGPLESARRTVERCGVKNVRLLRSDGLSAVDYADDVVIAGMGGELIAEIVRGCRFLSGDTRFILQPMTRADSLRRELYKSGFEIIEERCAKEGGRFYTVMLVRYTGVRAEIDELFALRGKMTDAGMLRSIANKLLKNADRASESENAAERARELYAAAEKILAEISE